MPGHRLACLTALLLLIAYAGNPTVLTQGKNGRREKATQEHDGRSLSLQVSPNLAVSGTFVQARIRVHPDGENRLLRVTVESPTYFRSSDVTLDGAAAAITHVVPLRALPAGSYAVLAIVYGTEGERARSLQRLELRSPHQSN